MITLSWQGSGAAFVLSPRKSHQSNSCLLVLTERLSVSHEATEQENANALCNNPQTQQFLEVIAELPGKEESGASRNPRVPLIGLRLCKVV